VLAFSLYAVRADEQEPDERPTVPGERAMDREDHIPKGTGGKSGGRAWKAVELITGDLPSLS
jgi:hypothetical protein